MRCSFVSLEKNDNGNWDIIQRYSSSILPNSKVVFTIQRIQHNCTDLKTAKAAAESFAIRNNQCFVDLSESGCLFVSVMSYQERGYLPFLMMPDKIYTDSVFPYESQKAFLVSALTTKTYRVPFIALPPECYKQNAAL